MITVDALKAVVPRSARRASLRPHRRPLAPSIPGRVAFGDPRRPVSRDFGVVGDRDSSTFERRLIEEIRW
jgi:hypothetical protein